MIASISEVVEAWPISFCIGVIVGLILAQRGYRIVRKNGNGNGKP